MRIGGQPAVHLPAKGVQVLLVETPFEKRARVDARGAVALKVDQIAGLILGGASEEVVEAHIVERGGGGEGGDVAAEIARSTVGAHHHRQRVPADQRANAALHEQVARHEGFLAGGNGVAVRRGDGVGQPGAGARQPGRQLLEKVAGPWNAPMRQDVLQGIEPLPGFDRIGVAAIRFGRFAAGGRRAAPAGYRCRRLDGL